MMFKKGFIALIIGYGIIVFCLMNSKNILSGDVYLPFVKVIIALLIGIFLCFLYQKDYKKSLFVYLVFVFLIMFYREKVDINVSFKFYLWRWLKIIFKNKSVLFSILGNVLLFLPLTILSLRIKERYIYVLLLIFLLVLVLEILQYFTKRGVFDVVDIILNYFGIILGACVYRAFKRKREEKNGTFI